MTLKEAFVLFEHIELEKAISLDIKIKLAGDKKGFRGLKRLLNKEKVIESKKINTHEATKENRSLFEKITSVVSKEK